MALKGNVLPKGDTYMYIHNLQMETNEDNWEVLNMTVF